MHKQLYEVLDTHDILNQFGFRKNSPTIHAQLEITERILTSLEKGNIWLWSIY